MKTPLTCRLRHIALASLLAFASLLPQSLAAPPAPSWKGQAQPVVKVAEAELATLRPAAEAGDAAAQIKLGHYYMDHYEEGFANEVTAGEWFRKAAEAGDAEGQAWYAIYLFVRSSSSTEGKAAAKPWAEKSAEQGNAIGLYLMGQMLSRQDVSARKDYYLPAAKQGFVPAMRALAAATLEDNEHPIEDRKDPVVKGAFKWLDKAMRARNCAAFMVASGSQGRRESFGFGQKTLVHPLKESEKYAKEAIALAIQREWQWYDTVFDFDMLVRRYAAGGARHYQVIRAYLNLRTLYEFKKEDKKAAKIPKQLVATLKKLAKTDPVAANFALAELLMNWKGLYFGPDVPAPAEDYRDYARKAAEAEPVNYCDYALRQQAAGM